MSSAVNKSSTRFAPKIGNRATIRGQPRRRTSSVRASFSTPADSERRESSAASAERPKLDKMKMVDEEAVEDDDTAASTPMPPPVGNEDVGSRRASVQAPTDIPDKAVAETEAAVIPESTEEPAAKPQIESDERSESKPSASEDKTSPELPKSSSKARAPAAAPISVAPIARPGRINEPAPASSLKSRVPLRSGGPLRLSTISEPLMAKRPRRTATSVAPIQKLPESLTEPRLKSQSPEPATSSKSSNKAKSTDGDAGPEAAAGAPAKQESVEPRQQRFDEEGREIIEPEDLPVMSRGHSLSEINLDNKAINVETFTMATLCSDIPIGETNEEYAKFESARISRKRRRARVLKAKQMVRGLYEPKKPGIREELEALYKEYREEREERFGKVKEESQAKLRAMDAEQAPQPAMKLQIGKGGKIQLDSESQHLDRHARNRADDAPAAAREIDKYSTVINSYSFSTKERPERWSEQETGQFYNALSVWGTDFNLIAHMFPNRSRNQIKTKFKYEERRYPDKINLYLIHRRKVNVEDYAKISGTEIIEIAKMEEDLEKVRGEHSAQMKLEADLKQRAMAEDAEKQLLADTERLEKQHSRNIKREKR